MTIVKPSSKPHRRSSIDLSLKKAKKLAKNAGIIDVFSNSQLPGFSKNEKDLCDDGECSEAEESQPAQK